MAAPAAPAAAVGLVTRTEIRGEPSASSSLSSPCGTLLEGESGRRFCPAQASPSCRSAAVSLRSADALWSLPSDGTNRSVAVRWLSAASASSSNACRSAAAAEI